MSREEILAWSEDQKINTILLLYSINNGLMDKLNEATDTIITLSANVTELSGLIQEMSQLVNKEG